MATDFGDNAFFLSERNVSLFLLDHFDSFVLHLFSCWWEDDHNLWLVCAAIAETTDVKTSYFAVVHVASVLRIYLSFVY